MSEPSGKSQVSRLTASNILYPGQNQTVLVNGYNPAAQTGTLLVSVAPNDAQVSRMFAVIQAAGGTVTWPATTTGAMPAGAFELPRGTGADANKFLKADSPIANLPATPPAADNLQVFVAGYDSAGNLRPAQANNKFTGVPSVISTAVDARGCIWLVYAGPTTAPLQFGETAQAGSPYVPAPLLVPDEATRVLVETLAGQPWRHDPADSQASGPEGIAGTEQPLDPTHQAVYRNATLNSANINSANLRLNRLAALWVYADPTTPATEIDIVQTNQQTVPTQPRPVSLRLAFHDGYQWSNNSGTTPVRVTWQS